MAGALKRTVKEFKEDNLTDWAAALTYYCVLAIFPALIVLVSILGLVGESATQPLIDNLGTVAPGPAKEIFTSAIKNLQGDQGAAGVLFVIGLLGALWSASGYVAAFMRASNAIYDIEEGRPVWKTLPVRVGAHARAAVRCSRSPTLAVVLTGGLAQKVGDLVGLGRHRGHGLEHRQVAGAAGRRELHVRAALLGGAEREAARASAGIARRHARGGRLADRLGRVRASTSANFGSYNKTYGALGGVIVFLVWLWISNIVILLGAEFNAELERGRAIEDGMRPAGQGAVRRAARHAQDGHQSRSPRERGRRRGRTPATPRRRSGRRSPRTPPSRRSSTARWREPSRRRSARGATCPSAWTASDLVLIGTASYKLSRLIAKKKVTAFVRAPFTELEGKGGPAELEEKPRGTRAAARARRAARLPLLPRAVGVRRLPRGAPVRAARDALQRIRAHGDDDLGLPPDRLQGRRGARARRLVLEDEELEPDVRLDA